MGQGQMQDETYWSTGMQALSLLLPRVVEMRDGSLSYRVHIISHNPQRKCSWVLTSSLIVVSVLGKLAIRTNSSLCCFALFPCTFSWYLVPLAILQLSSLSLEYLFSDLTFLLSNLLQTSLSQRVSACFSTSQKVCLWSSVYLIRKSVSDVLLRPHKLLWAQYLNYL